MQAPVPPKIAWDVLTDFGNMEKWVPNVRESKIVSNNGNVLTIEQKGTFKFGLLSIPYTSVRKMELEPEKTILATQVQGSMRKLVSLMRVTPEGRNAPRLPARDGAEHDRVHGHVQGFPEGRAHRAVHGDRRRDGPPREVISGGRATREAGSRSRG